MRTQKKLTLLETALGAMAKRPDLRVVTPEEIELLIAWVNKEVDVLQMATALGLTDSATRSAQVHAWAGTKLRQCIQQRLVVLSRRSMEADNS